MPPPTLSLYCHILNLVYHISICIYSICEFIHDYFRIHVEGEKTNELWYHHRLHFAFHFHSLYVVFFCSFFRHELKQNPWIQMKATTIQKAYQPATIGRNSRQKQSTFTKWKINYFYLICALRLRRVFLRTFAFHAFFLLHLFFAA